MKSELLSTLAHHGIVPFAGRWIYEAQPPITEQQRNDVEAHLRGPIPNDLLTLWSITFGGRLQYDLHLTFDGVDEPLSMSLAELFFPNSGAYRDLPGWLEAELEGARFAASERGEEPPTHLSYLPFGGFEYLERFYVKVDEPDVGSVWAWRMALPPTWNHPLKANGFVRCADHLMALFEQFEVRLESDVTGILYDDFREEVVGALPADVRESFWDDYTNTKD